MFEVQYLEDFHPLLIRPVKVEPISFFSDQVPEPFTSISFFIEHIKSSNHYFLRHKSNSYFCRMIYDLEVQVKVPKFSEELNFGYDEESAKLLIVFFEGQQRLLGYEFRGESTNFLVKFDTDLTFSQLPDEQRILYTSATLSHHEYIADEEFLVNRRLQLND